VLVAHACNPGYSGVRDQEDLSLKPAWANNLQNPTPPPKKKTFTERAGEVAQGTVLEFKPQYYRKNPKQNIGLELSVRTQVCNPCTQEVEEEGS
jgi:hypothetical protein